MNPGSTHLAQQLETFLLEEAHCHPREPLVVAVSGGLDSMVLLHLLHGLAPRHQWRLIVAHFNHRLRGRASGADALFVRRTARRLGHEVRVEAEAVGALAHRAGISVEMAARQARHAFLARVARQAGAGKIVLGHHAQDQVELFFVRLLQGAGPTGLKGMEKIAPSPADAGVQLLRPLLEVPRAALADYADQFRVRYREDESNASPEPLRNRIRHQLLPLLSEWQPGLSAVILRTMELLRAEDAFMAAETVAQAQRGDAPPAQWPLALQRRHLARELIRLGVEPHFELIEFLRRHPREPIMVTGGRRVQADAQLNLHRLAEPESLAHAPERLHLQLSAGGEIRWQNHTLRWEIRDRKAGEAPAFQRGVEWFDAERIGGWIGLRYWQPGDRYWPIGAKAEMKLQDFFVNLKVPAAERRRRLVAVAADGRIFWVEGCRIAEPFKVQAQSRRLLRWQWETGAVA
ncbi:MAG: tRNA lysidine(34) synthetase TilS [Verrucomicrobiae bacterium]|nr:tRNA lysidine(34) synthetase TilS [Verrucomicrobiae bacterium]